MSASGYVSRISTLHIIAKRLVKIVSLNQEKEVSPWIMALGVVAEIAQNITQVTVFVTIRLWVAKKTHFLLM